MAKDYYKVLGITRSSNSDEIKKAYRKLAHQYHPDKETGDESKFKEISEAYAVLSDEKKRSEYDAYGRTFNGAGGGARGGFDFNGFSGSYGETEFDLNDILNEFFGGFSNRVRRGRDISIDIEITFKDSIFGLEKKVIYQRPVHSTDSVERKSNEVSIKIPGGIESGQMIRVSGAGEVIQDGVAGDLYIKVHVQENSAFSKQGADIVKELHIKLTDALLGAEYKVQTLDKVIKVKIPTGINQGEILRVKGEGVVIDANRRGDLLLPVKIDIPKRIPRKAKKHVEALKSLGL